MLQRNVRPKPHMLPLSVGDLLSTTATPVFLPETKKVAAIVAAFTAEAESPLLYRKEEEKT